VEDWEAVVELINAEDWVTVPTTPVDIEATRRWSSMRISCVSEPAEILSDPPEPVPPVFYEERWAWAFFFL
jgi:hypothetical protein